MITIWSKFVQHLLKVGGRENIILAGLLVKDKQSFVYYYHVGKYTCEKLHLQPIEASWLAMDLVRLLVPDFYSKNFLETHRQRNFIDYLEKLYKHEKH